MEDIKRIAPQLWYRYIAGRLGCTSAYAVEKALEPNLFGRNAVGSPHHAGKWTKYAAGKRYPRLDLVDRVEAKVAGSKAVLLHPLWEVVSVSGNARSFTDTFRRLLPDIQLVLFQSDSTGAGELNRRDIDETLLDDLESRAGLDALAALTALFLEAIGKSEWPLVAVLGPRLYRMLLIASIEEPLAWVSLALFDVYARSVFPLASTDGLAFQLGDIDHSCTCSTLMYSMACCTIDELTSTAKQRLALARGMLRGQFGRNLHHAFMPPRGALQTRAPLDPEAWEELRRGELLRLAGIGQILRGVDRWLAEQDSSEDRMWRQANKISGIYDAARSPPPVSSTA